MRFYVIGLGCMVALLPLVTRAGFNAGGIETFAGNTFDSATWTPANKVGTPIISQNNELDMVSDGFPDAGIEYKAMQHPLSVGTYVQTDFILHSHNAPSDRTQQAILALTSDSTSPAKSFIDDSFFVSMYAIFNLSWFYSADGANGTGSGPFIPDVHNAAQTIVPALDTHYTMRIDWPNKSLFITSVYDGSGNLLGSRNIVPSHTVPSTLFVDIGASNVTMTFFNVQTGTVPEPSTLMTLGVGIAGLAVRKRVGRRSRSLESIG